MSEDVSVDLNRLASQVFGDLAVPYPDMSVSSTSGSIPVNMLRTLYYFGSRLGSTRG